ncbi:MAG TPA: hypothetical protein VIH90_03045 [Candidatus Saccharimonadales bacterium]
MGIEKHTTLIIPEGREAAIGEIFDLAHRLGLGMTQVVEVETDAPTSVDDERFLAEGEARWRAYLEEVGPEAAVAGFLADAEAAAANWLGIRSTTGS